MDKQVVISVKTILITLLMVMGAYIVYRLAPVFAVLLIALLLVIAMEPLVKYFSGFTLLNKPVSRALAVIISYFIFILFVLVILTIGLPVVVVQGQKLLMSLTASVSGQSLAPNLQLSDLLPQISQLSGNVFGIVSSSFSSITTIFSVLMLSIYMSLDWINLKHRLLDILGPKNRDEGKVIIEEIEHNIGSWVKGELILMTVIGSFTFVGLSVLGIKYPLALALVAGLLEAVPILGPVISAVLASIIGFSEDPVKGLAVIALFIVIQQLENNILVPKIMQKVSGFSPLVILIALLIGSEFFGIVGAIIAVPVTVVGVVILKSVLRHTA